MPIDAPFYFFKGLFLRDNPYQTLNTSKFVDSSSVSLELKTNGNPIEIANLTNPLKIAVPRDITVEDRPHNDSVRNRRQ
jgi:hypothetical protein